MLEPRRLAALLATGALLALPIAGCGDDDDDGGDESTTEAATTSTTGGGAGGAVSISETEYALDPADPTVPAGTVTFNVRNDGQTTHALEVEGPGEEAETENIDPGGSAELTVDLSEPGTYEFYCPVDGHKDKGMEGEITVN